MSGEYPALRILAHALSRDARAPLLQRHPEYPPVPLASREIDVVYTWVDPADPAWRRRFGSYCDEPLSDVQFRRRYGDHGEIVFSLQTLHHCFPDVRHVFIVTDDQSFDLTPVPERLRRKVRFVSHRDIIDPQLVALPTFNSTILTAFLWRIPGLSECFVYLNDDVFLGDRLSEADLVGPTGVARAYLRPRRTAPRNSEDDQEWALHSRKSRDLFVAAFGQEPNFASLHLACLLHRRACELTFDQFAANWRSGFFRERVRGPRSLAFGVLANWVGIHHGYQEAADYLPLLRRTRFVDVLDARQRDWLLRDRPLWFCINKVSDPAVFRQLTSRYLAQLEGRATP